MLPRVLVHQVMPADHVDLEADLLPDLERLRDKVHGVEVAADHLANRDRLHGGAGRLLVGGREGDDAACVARLSASFGEEDRILQLDLPLLLHRGRHRFLLWRRCLATLALALALATGRCGRRTLCGFGLFAPDDAGDEFARERVALAVEHADVALGREREGDMGILRAGGCGRVAGGIAEGERCSGRRRRVDVSCGHGGGECAGEVGEEVRAK